MATTKPIDLLTPIEQEQLTLLRTPRLLLKGLMSTDAHALFQYRSLPEVTRFQGWAPTSVEEAVRFVEDEICHKMDQPETWFQFGIFLRKDKTLVGDLGIHFFTDESTAEIGVTVAPVCQGQGYAEEAVLRVLGFLFETLGKSRVVASVDPENQKSMALMKRVGFELEGIYKNAFVFRGEWTDDAAFVMTRDQWRSR